MVKFDNEQEALALVERLKECEIAPERIRIYEWVDVMSDGDLNVLSYKSRFAVMVANAYMFID